MYVFGGQGWGATAGSGTQGDLMVYDPATDTWKHLGKGPSARSHASLVAIGNKLYLYGGSGSAYFADIWEYDPATSKWKELTASPNQRSEHTAVAINDRMYVFGGTRGSGYFNDLYFYDPATDRWTQLGLGATQRHEHVAVAIGGKMYVFGGHQANANNDLAYLNDLWVYDVAANAWTQLPSGATKRHHSAAVVLGEEMYVFAGTRVLGGSEMNDLWRVS
jgi:N-acetylneuraminic acid mutarotase